MNILLSISTFFKQLREHRETPLLLLFIVVFLGVYFFIDYHHILFYRPQALHFMRQTDCLAFVQSYYNNGMDFFEPRVLNLQSVDGKAMGEFPILYYLTAVLYHVFGQHEFILRLINLLLASTGFYYIFKLFIELLGDIFYSVGFTLFFLSSTILLYYINNFLPDAGALGLTLTSFYFFYQFITNGYHRKHFLISTLLLTTAALIKITYGLYLVAALLTFLISIGFLFKTKPTQKSITYLLSYLVALVIIAGWYLFLIHYNQVNHVASFLTTTTPIWNLSVEKIGHVWEYVSHYWYTTYYYESSLHTMYIILIAGFLLVHKSNKTILTFALLSFSGSVCYVLLFFNQFTDHDYYFLTLVPTIILLVISSFLAIKNNFPKLINSWIVKMVFLSVVVLSLIYTKEKLSDRYATTDIIYSPIGLQLNHADQYLQHLDVSDNATFIVIKDNTPNGSLYFLNRRGWTIADTNHLTKSHSLFLQSDFLLLSDSSLLKNSVVSNLQKIKIGEYNGAFIYQLIK